MKNLRKVISILMVISMFICCFTAGGRAAGLNLPDYTQTQAEWDSYWETVKGNNTQIALTPGADETELNFNWHSDRELKIPRVRMSKNADMSDAVEFIGYSTLADNKQQTNRVTAKGLEENTIYWYSYSLGKDNWSEPEFYRTLSAESFKAILIGDVQCGAGDDGYGYENASNWNRTLNTALKKNPDTSFILNCGDQINSGKSAVEWAATLSPKALRNIPMATTIGNHDKKGSIYKHYVNNPNSQLISMGMYTGTQYYFRYGDVLFMSFNSTNFNVFEAYNLAEKAISENPDAKWRVAFFHHDVYGTGHHAADDDNYLLQGAFGAIADKFEIDVVFNGHEHYYGRSYNMLNNEIVDLDYSKKSVVDPDGTVYITTASAGGRNRVYDEPYSYPWLAFSYMSDEITYSEVEFTDTTFSIKTFTVDGEKLIDEYKITKTEFDYQPVDKSENLLFNTNALERILSHFMGDYYIIVEVLVKVVKTALNAVSAFIIK